MAALIEKVRTLFGSQNRSEAVQESPPPQVTTAADAGSILDAYVKSAPARQNIIDIFQGEWSSTMPQGSGLKSEPGTAALFEDDRIVWANSALGGFAGKDLLELGPLECGHSYMMQNFGAKSITAIESNQRAFMKCLGIKEIFNLDRVHIQLGDFVPFLNETEKRFDAVVVSGVLYHMTDPISVLSKIARVSDNLFFWTHYLIEEFGAKNSQIFEIPHSFDLGSFTGIGAKRYYRQSLEWRGFCGGSEPFAVWLTKDTILNHLKSLGFTKIKIHVDAVDHPNGPAMSFSAQRDNLKRRK